MRNRKNFFGGWEDLDEIFRQFFSADPSITGNRNMKQVKDENGEWTENTFSSEDGRIHVTSFIRTSGLPQEYEHLFNNQKRKPSSIESLKKELDRAVENEDFQLAIKIRDMIKEKENNKGLVEQLEAELKDCIERQDFEKAIEVREQLKKYRD
jgi:protein-arginine kinase activator protein McsA